MLPWQPASELPCSLAAVVLIVSAGGGASNLSILGKTYNMMLVDAPLLCQASEGSKLEKLVDKHQNGRCFSHDNIEDIAVYIEKVASNAEYRKMLGENSLKASKEYTVDNAKLFLAKC